jgi:hypothetical protein
MTANLTLIEKLQLIEGRRQFLNWKPRQAASEATESFNPILIRAVGLRGLEIPVGEWTAQFIQDTPELSPIHHILLGHIEDEENHDTQLEYLAEHMGAKVVPEEADILVDHWLTLNCHPLLKKMVLEAGVFFPLLGMMGVYGKSNILIQNVRQWISSDESAHVASSRLIIDYLRRNGQHIVPPPALMTLVQDTIKYICQGTDEEKWLKASLSGITTGKIFEGERLTTVAVQDPFTQNRNSEILYQSR